MDIFNTVFQLSAWQIIACMAVAVLVGLSKTGFSAVGLFAVPILTSAFGGIASTGLMLSMLIIGDLFAVKAFSKQGRWDEILKLLPPTLGGMAIGLVVGSLINDQQFKIVIASIIILCSLIMVWMELKGGKIKVPKNILFIILAGVLSGFATMIGNAAGPIFAIYLLAIGLNKDHYLGTMAWFFLIVNLIKVPLQVFVWHNINLSTVILALITIPGIYVGARLGVSLIKKFPEKLFRYLIIGMAVSVSIVLIIG